MTILVAVEGNQGPDVLCVVLTNSSDHTTTIDPCLRSPCTNTTIRLESRLCFPVSGWIAMRPIREGSFETQYHASKRTIDRYEGDCIVCRTESLQHVRMWRRQNMIVARTKADPHPVHACVVRHSILSKCIIPLEAFLPDSSLVGSTVTLFSRV